MANRPRPTSRASKSSPKHNMTQAEINRVKPAGVLSFDILEKEARKINAINVRFPDGEIYKFFHLPMSIGDGEELFQLSTEQNRLVGLRQLLTRLMVNENGTPFATYEQWEPVPLKILNLLHEAMSNSAKDEPGED